MGGVEIIRRKRMIFLFSVLAGLVNDGWRTIFFQYIQYTYCCSSLLMMMKKVKCEMKHQQTYPS